MFFFSAHIEGESAWPELIPGKNYFATSFFKPKVGDFIVFHNPKNLKDIFVKKIKAMKSNSYFVTGTVSFAESSKSFGWVNKDLVLGKILK